MALQPQSLPILNCRRNRKEFNFRNEKQIWPFFVAKRIAAATVSLPTKKKQRLLESEQACGHHLQLFNVGGLSMKPSKIAAYNFDRVSQSQTSTANRHRRETVHLALH